eukprot:12420251-Karenia_brevis.AAC.2
MHTSASASACPKSGGINTPFWNSGGTVQMRASLARDVRTAVLALPPGNLQSYGAYLIEDLGRVLQSVGYADLGPTLTHIDARVAKELHKRALGQRLGAPQASGLFWKS